MHDSRAMTHRLRFRSIPRPAAGLRRHTARSPDHTARTRRTRRPETRPRRKREAARRADPQWPELALPAPRLRDARTVRRPGLQRPEPARPNPRMRGVRTAHAPSHAHDDRGMPSNRLQMLRTWTCASWRTFQAPYLRVSWLMLRMVRRLDVFTVPYKGLEKSSPVFSRAPMNAERKPPYERHPQSLVAAEDGFIKKQPHRSSCTGKRPRKETSLRSLIVAGDELLKKRPSQT